jgi:hypothetical protein
MPPISELIVPAIIAVLSLACIIAVKMSHSIRQYNKSLAVRSCANLILTGMIVLFFNYATGTTPNDIVNALAGVLIAGGFVSFVVLKAPQTIIGQAPR